MTKHITNGINHALLESLALSEEIATAPIAREGSGLKIKKCRNEDLLEPNKCIFTTPVKLVSICLIMFYLTWSASEKGPIPLELNAAILI